MKIQGTCKSRGDAPLANLSFEYDSPTFEDAQKNPALVKVLNELSRKAMKVVADAVARQAAGEADGKAKEGTPNPTPKAIQAAAQAVAKINLMDIGSAIRAAGIGKSKLDKARGVAFALAQSGKVDKAKLQAAMTVELGGDTLKSVEAYKALHADVAACFEKKVKAPAADAAKK